MKKQSLLQTIFVVSVALLLRRAQSRAVSLGIIKCGDNSAQPSETFNVTFPNLTVTPATTELFVTLVAMTIQCRLREVMRATMVLYEDIGADAILAPSSVEGKSRLASATDEIRVIPFRTPR